MEHRTVGGGTAGYAEAFNHALETFALGNANNVNQLAFGEGRDINDVSDFERGGIREADFAEDARSVGETGFCGVLFFASGCVLLLLRGEADLNGIVAVGGRGLDLNDGARAGFNHGDGN